MDDEFSIYDLGTWDDYCEAVEALNRADNLYRHLRRNVKQAVQHPALDSPTKVRRLSGLQWRMQFLQKAHDDVRSAMEKIVKAYLMDTESRFKDLPAELASMRARDSARKRLEKNPDAKAKAEAMDAIKATWQSMERRETPFMKDAKFARVMQHRYPVLENEGSIQNAIRRWRKEKSSS